MVVNFHDPKVLMSQGAGGPLIPDIGLEGGASDVSLNCSGLNWARRL